MVWLDPEVKDRLKRVADARRAPMSAVAAEAVEREVERFERAAGLNPDADR